MFGIIGQNLLKKLYDRLLFRFDFVSDLVIISLNVFSTAIVELFFLCSISVNSIALFGADSKLGTLFVKMKRLKLLLWNLLNNIFISIRSEGNTSERKHE